MQSIDITWVIGGPQGSGVESAANIFARACAVTGLQIFGKREFYSNIKGEHSYFAVRISDKKIRSNVEGITLLVAFDAETVFRHVEDVYNDGAIICDSDLVQVNVDEVHTLEDLFKSRLKERLSSKNKEFTVQGLLDICKERGVTIHLVSFKNILASLAEETQNPSLKNMFRMLNVLAVSLSLGFLGLSSRPLLESVGTIFSSKPKIAEINKQAANYGYNFATVKFPKFKYSIPVVQKEPSTILIQGHQASGLGKMACGCRFQSYYPITPASDESVFLESNEVLDVKNNRPGSTLIVQTEDEISAIGMVIGSALTGARSSTSTSGPGFSLMAEALGWAGINEVPIVITLYQRSGPSTGLPTRHGQDDLMFAIHAGHGDFPKIVYSSGDVEETFYDTTKCFNFAEYFQIPVIHILDKFLASTITTCKKFDSDLIIIDRGKLLEKIENDGYKRFAFTEDNISPRSKLGLENGIFWNTGDESDEFGHISEDPINRVQMMNKRASKLDLALKEIPKDDQAISFGISEFCVLSWGSTKGPILDAIDMLKKEGLAVGFIQIKLLQPFPTDYLKSLLEGTKIIIDIEANQGAQLGSLLNEHLDKKVDYYILKYTGRAMTSTEICDSLKKILQNKAETNQVLTYGI
ncbi:MAG TPA: 2-oxoacid:ferredoxin oxidoreductase subunit alpha [Nitrosopumilaceae archaeon]|nr:2-oxoacid:ferredoxin oxidoreductase subunit alpha [Nitrosopumilaceae archaeon]